MASEIVILAVSYLLEMYLTPSSTACIHGFLSEAEARFLISSIPPQMSILRIINTSQLFVFRKLKCTPEIPLRRI